MCQFITLVVRGRIDDVSDILVRHGRRFELADNASVRAVLSDGEVQVLTTNGACDCGTVLGREPLNAGADAARETARLRKKGWSEAKVQRALQDQVKASSRPDNKAVDSTLVWADLLRDVLETRGVLEAGLLVHQYSRGVSDEVFDVARRDAPRDVTVETALEAMREDEVMMFSVR